MKVILLCILISSHNLVTSRGVRRKKMLDEVSDYDASGDYFEATTELKKVEQEATTKPSTSNEEMASDDGVTCSMSNFTDVLIGYELENHVLAVFKVNVSENEKEVVLFLNLARRFSEMSAIFNDLKFVIITSDHSSEVVLDFIEKEGFPGDVAVIDEDEFGDFGFVIDLDELHVYIVDQCGKLAFIVVPPWSSAKHPYVKAAIISTIIDLSCGCPTEKFASHQDVAVESQTEHLFEDVNPTAVVTETDSTVGSTMYSNIPVIDIDSDDIENIEDLLDNANSIIKSSPDGSTPEINLPLRIVIPSQHMHFDDKTQSYWKYDQFVLQTSNQSYHGHLQGGEKLVEIEKNSKTLFNITSSDSKIFVGNRSLNDVQYKAKSDRIFFDVKGQSYKIQKEFIGPEKIYELIPVEFDIIKVAPVQQIFGVRHHYKQLNRWLLFKI